MGVSACGAQTRSEYKKQFYLLSDAFFRSAAHHTAKLMSAVWSCGNLCHLTTFSVVSVINGEASRAAIIQLRAHKTTYIYIDIQSVLIKYVCM